MTAWRQHERVVDSTYEVDIRDKVLNSTLRESGQGSLWARVVEELKPHVAVCKQMVPHVDLLLDKTPALCAKAPTGTTGRLRSQHLDVVDATQHADGDISATVGAFAVSVPHGALKVPGSNACVLELQSPDRELRVLVECALLPVGMHFEYFTGAESPRAVLSATRKHHAIVGRAVDARKNTSSAVARSVFAHEMHAQIARNLWSVHGSEKVACKNMFGLTLSSELPHEHTFYTVFV